MDSHGALVGWSHHDLGDRLLLRIESFGAPAPGEERVPDITRLLLTKQQAVVLGTYLIGLAGHQPPRPGARSRLRRLFG